MRLRSNYLVLFTFLSFCAAINGQNNFKFMIGVGNITPLSTIEQGSREIDYVKDVRLFNFAVNSSVTHRVWSDKWYAGVKGSYRHIKDYSHGEEFQLAGDIANGTNSINYYYVDHSSISYGPTVRYIPHNKVQFELSYLQMFHFDDRIFRRTEIGYQPGITTRGSADGIYDFANSLLSVTAYYKPIDKISLGVELGRYMERYSLDRLFAIYTRYDVTFSVNYHW